MTNITLSIDDDTYKKMKKFSEIKWSDFVRKIIRQRIKEIEKINEKNWENTNIESILTMLASEEVLKKDWLTKEEDETWKDL